MPPSRARPTLSQPRIVQAAVALADAEGVAGLSMRKVARRLGVEAMSLYHHVGGKDALLGAMVDSVFAEVSVPVEGGWRSRLTSRAHALRAALQRHPWATPLLDSRSEPGPATLAHHDAVVACLHEAGFPWPDVAHAFSLMDSYIYGFALQEEALPLEQGADLSAAASELNARLPAETYPALAAFAAAQLSSGRFDPDAEFDFGLRLILDGLAARLSAI